MPTGYFTVSSDNLDIERNQTHMTTLGSTENISNSSLERNMSDDVNVVHEEHKEGINYVAVGIEFAYLLLIGLIGLQGNGVLWFVLKRNSRKNSTDIMTMALACVDFSCSSLYVVLKILRTKVIVYVLSTWFCRILAYVGAVTTFTTAVLLVSISIDRYLKVYFPLKETLTCKLAKRLCCGIAIFSFVWNAPQLRIYIQVDEQKCSLDDKITAFITIYQYSFASIIILSFTLMTVFYVKVGLLMRRNRKFHADLKQSGTKAFFKSDQNSRTESSMSKSGPSSEVDIAISIIQDENTHGQEDPEPQTQNPTKCIASIKLQMRKPKRPLTAKERAMNRTTKIVFYISIVYIVLFGFGIVMVYSNFLFGPIVNHFGFTFSMFNCITNPFIYILMSSKFRADAKKLLCGK